LALGDRQGPVGIGEVAVLAGHEGFAAHCFHGLQHQRVAHAAGVDLLANHGLAGG
jgi:hypothetical protein